ncbi:transcription factor TFIIIB component B'' homolog [Orussus abietinus]|uniref:transcription factor TFIIIB component B'' homolog n=1 Tax=Orussus abietinus TaxID=222816 RepID=UPI0006258124|nr:transcription factor TFIIIB component B'' homolog [Orussus abietinus]
MDPAASPSKLLHNRACFVRPVPRLDGCGRIRRNSVHGSGASASESEDDCRKSSTTVPLRARNDSICSAQSNKETPAIPSVGNSIPSKPGQKRRLLISESARKLAEARREFLLKYENKAPDRSKLTMYDLIYYNPTTNPIKKVAEKEQVTVPSASIPDKIEEANVDDPEPIPVPRVKVGPDGQLIIDEQSLTIERTNAKKDLEALANSGPVLDEGLDNNGFYKRRQKSKEWAKWETLKFYKALTTVGTDFLLMQSLFPERSRHEIKAKFKKEEKTNRALVQKALSCHQEFDIDTLKKDLATFDEADNGHFTETIKSKRKMKTNSSHRGSKGKLCRIVASSIDESGSLDDTDTDEPRKLNKGRPQQTQRLESAKWRSSKSSTIEHNLLFKDCQTKEIETASVVSSDSDTEIYKIRPTRSGRAPKVRKLRAPEVNAFDESSSKLLNEDVAIVPEESTDTSSENVTSILDEPSVIHRVVRDTNKVQPGSLVILSRESEEDPRATVMQVYMVGPNVNSENTDLQPINHVQLPQELLATVTTKLPESDPLALKVE